MMKKIMTSVVVLLMAVSAGAALVASDNASDAAYDDNWITGDNGGSGFGAWTLATGGGSAGHFIGDSTSLAAPGADINVSGESFGMYGHSGQEASAIRSFSGDLSVGQTFSIELAVNFRNGFKGLDLRNSSDATIINFNVAGDDYQMGGVSIGNTYSDNTEFLLAFAQTSAGAGTWSITRSGGVGDLDTGTYTGVASGFKLYNGSTTGGGINEDNLFANSMSVIPEPATLGLLSIAGALTLFVRRAFMI